ncbi:hypothetical protein [Lentzea guizhouensis]|nr:hypothetical protein [Lentzea guizhouensis]
MPAEPELPPVVVLRLAASPVEPVAPVLPESPELTVVWHSASTHSP